MPATAASPSNNMGGFYDVGLTYNPTNAKSRVLSRSDLYELCSGKWTGTDLDEAVAVILAESSGKSDVESSNPDGNKNIGLFQIDTVNVQHPEYLKDTVYNANVAQRMWLADGKTFTKRWESAAKGKEKAFLPGPGDPHGPGDEATNPVDDTARAAKSGINAVGDFFNTLGEGSTWVRIGLITGGAILVAIGLYEFGKIAFPGATSTAKTVGKVAVTKRPPTPKPAAAAAAASDIAPAA